MILDIHPENPEGRKINQLKEILENGGIAIVPTDSVYAIICDMAHQKAVDKICKLRQLDPVKANLTFLCENIARIANYTAPIQNEYFRLIKRNTPAPVTFILKSNQTVPKLFKNKKRTIGARIPDHKLLQTLITEMDRPLMSTSLKLADQDFHENDIDVIISTWAKRVDVIVRCGTVSNHESTVIDLTGSEMEYIREGTHTMK